MKYKATLLLCLMLLHFRIATSMNMMMMSSGSGGSGDNPVMPMNNSGSGSGLPPTITNCPISLNSTVTPQLGLFIVNISIMLTINDDNLLSDTAFSTMNTMQDITTSAELESDGSFLVISINGSALNSVAMPITEINVTIIANNGFGDSEVCIVAVSIDFLPANECRTGAQVRTPDQQATRPDQQQMRAISIPVEQPPSQIGLSVQMAIANALVTFLNSYCRQNCDQCALSSDCRTLLQFCVEFTIDNVIIVDIIEVPAVSVNINLKRQVSVTTTSNILLAVTVPAEIPVTDDVPLVPADTVLQVVLDNLNTFESMTGLQLNGNPVVLFTSPGGIPIDFGDIAVIVLPIVVTVLVLALVGGVATILLVVYILKVKKKSKVLPAHQASQRSIGKGHMSLEAVDN